MANDIKDIAAPQGNLGDVMMTLSEQGAAKGLDKVRNVLAMRMNQYVDIPLTDVEVRSIAKSFLNIEAGAATNLVMICKKESCLYQSRCVLFENNKCPEGRECLHENYMLAHYMNQYLESLEVDINNLPEMVLINQLVEYEVIEYRCNAILSTAHPDLKWLKVIGLDKKGEIVEAEEISYAFNIKQAAQKQKLAILQEFTATRREKYKKQAALKEAKEGPSKAISDLKSQLEKMREKAVDADMVSERMNALSDMD